MSMFTRLDTDFTRYGLPTIAPSDVRHLTEFEESAYDHWIFDKGNSDGLVGRVAGRVLTAQSDAPTYSSNYLTMSNASGKALLTDVPDGASLVATVFAVAQFPANTYGNPGPVFGTYNGSAGFMATVASSYSSAVFFRGTTNAMSLVVDPSGAANEWRFFAVSVDLASATKVIRGQSNADFAQASPVAGAYTPSALTVGLGNRGYASAPAVNFNYVEFGIVLGYAMSQTELAQLYARSKARMAVRGVAI